MSGLDRAKKDLLKSLIGSASNPKIDLNKLLDEKSDDELIERYCSIEESLIESCKEMKLMREGKIPKKTWREFREELKNE